jgi:hypothetical protein
MPPLKARRSRLCSVLKHRSWSLVEVGGYNTNAASYLLLVENQTRDGRGRYRRHAAGIGERDEPEESY